MMPRVASLLLMGLFISCVSGADPPIESEPNAVGATRPIVGVIRWDAWYGRGAPVTAVEKTLGPRKYHWRLPFFGRIQSPDSVSIDGDAPQVIEQEIAYAASAGLNYWAFVDYWDQGNLGIALRRYREAQDKRGLRFCLIEEGGRIDQIGTSGWPRLTACFQSPDYQRVLGDRPLLFVFGRPKVIGRREFASLAEQTQAAGLGRPYFVLMGWNPRTDADEARGLGFDAVSAYAAGVGYRWEQWSYAQLTEHVRTAYWDVCRQRRIPCITFATTGWDPRPRIEHPAPWMPIDARPDPTPAARQHPLIDAATATPAQLARHVREAINWTRANVDLNPTQAVIIYAWNENDEGGWLIPTLGPDASPDTSRLDALRSVLRQ